MDSAVLGHDPPRERSPAGRNRRRGHEVDEGLWHAVVGGKFEIKVPRTKDAGDVGFTQPRGQFDKRIKHGLEIEGRAADDLEHVGGGGLLLQRFPAAR